MTRSTAGNRPRTLPRWLHPGAWWVWALGLATAASRTTNPLLLVLIVMVAALVVSARRPDAPWGRSFDFFLRLGVVVIIVRVGVQVVFGAATGSTLLLPLPGIVLPDWLAGIRLGGDVMVESVLLALFDGLRLATILICIGAANSLASPHRLLKSVPPALYEVGVSIVIALTFTPQLITDVTRVQAARHLRGRTGRGVRAIAGSAMPVFEGALDRSVTLAAAMDSRGYGRRAERDRRGALAPMLLLIGMVAAAIGTYGLVADEAPLLLQLPMLIAGIAIAVVATTWASRTSTRSRYRPDPWRGPEWLVSGSGVLVALTFLLSGQWWTFAMLTQTDPPTWPALPWLPLVGLALAATPARTAPPVPQVMPGRDRDPVRVAA